MTTKHSKVTLRLHKNTYFSLKDVDINEFYTLTKNFSNTIANLLDLAPQHFKTSLIETKNTSAAYTLNLPDYAATAIAQVLSAVDANDYQSFSEQAFNDFEEVARIVEAKDALLDIIAAEYDSGVAKRATLNPKIKRERPLTDAYIKGSTSVFGRCVKVGGDKKPSAEIKPPEGTVFKVYLDNQEVAKTLATKLYRDVVLEGEATWKVSASDAGDNIEMVHFQVTKIVPYDRENVPLSCALEELAEASGNAWDNVSPEAYVKNLRQEN